MMSVGLAEVVIKDQVEKLATPAASAAGTMAAATAWWRRQLRQQ